MESETNYQLDAIILIFTRKINIQFSLIKCYFLDSSGVQM